MVTRHSGRTRGRASANHDDRLTLAEMSFDDALYFVPGTYTWRKPVGAMHLMLQVQGAGGGGAGGDGIGGSGGAPGASVEVWLFADDIPDSATVTVGTGGLAGAANSNGVGGADSSFLWVGEEEGGVGYTAEGGPGGLANGNPALPGFGNDLALLWVQLASYAGTVFETDVENGAGAVGVNGARGLPGRFASGGGGGTDPGFVGGAPGRMEWEQTADGNSRTIPYGGLGGGAGEGTAGSDAGPGGGGGGGGADPDAAGGRGGHGWVRVRTFGLRPERMQGTVVG